MNQSEITSDNQIDEEMEQIAMTDVPAVQAEEEKKKRKFFIWLWLIPIISLLLAIALLTHELGWYRYPWEVKAIIGGSLKTGNLPGMTDEELLEALQKEVDESMISFKINGRPVFNGSTEEGSLLISNPPHSFYDFEVNIFLNETGEQIYSSGMIPPGYYIDYDKLSVILAQGVHDATAYIKFYNGSLMVNSVSVSQEITIK